MVEGGEEDTGGGGVRVTCARGRKEGYRWVGVKVTCGGGRRGGYRWGGVKVTCSREAGEVRVGGDVCVCICFVCAEQDDPTS